MNDTKLLMQIKLSDPGGLNSYFLRVTEHSDRHLSYRLNSLNTSTGFSLSNMQIRRPLPVWNDMTPAEMETVLREVIATGVYRWVSCEHAPGAIEPEEEEDRPSKYDDCSLSMPEIEKCISHAREKYAGRSDDNIEIDEAPALSDSEDGTWVAAWVWVSFEDAGVTVEE